MLFSILKVQRTKLKASHDKDYWLCAIDMKRSSWDTYSYVYFLCIKMYSDSLLYVIVESVCDKKIFLIPEHIALTFSSGMIGAG